MSQLFLVNPGPRPPYFELAHYLWGDAADFDSDGDSNAPMATDWTELTLIRRPDYSERIDIHPLRRDASLVLRLVSDSKDLVQRAATFLVERSGGFLRE